MRLGAHSPRATSPRPHANRELLATGLANAGGALLGAMPGGGGTSQTAVNRLAGARTQLAEFVTAAMTLVTMLLLAPLMGLMPQATLAAVVIVYSIGLIKPAEFREILSVRRTEFIWALTAFAGVVLLGTLKGLSSRSSCPWLRLRTRQPIRRSTFSDASQARMCSDHAPRRTPKMKPILACCS